MVPRVQGCGVLLMMACVLQFDPYKAAENSRFNKKNPPPPRRVVGTGPGAKPAAGRPGFKTLADLGGS